MPCFVQLFPDGEWVQPTLASNVSAFMATEKDNFPLDANHGFVWRGEQFRNLSPYIWENPIYTRFFEFLDRAGGFFYERWGDCPVHSFGLAMTLRKDQAVQFKDMGYQHQGWEFTCPVESSSCTCVQEEKFKSFKDRGEEWFNA
ncbi:hypothetical protein DXG01_010023 [Tephrocybe rancida]|nr:hypothetical protein DXG01_010023 [Tephrocybe rancida]